MGWVNTKQGFKAVLVLAVFASATVFTSGCGKAGNEDDDGPIPHQDEVYAKMSVRLDPVLSHTEKALLIGDLYQSFQYPIQAPAESYFTQAFGGSDTEAVTRYLNDRIHYIIPAQLDLDTRLSLVHHFPSLLQANNSGPGKTYTIALNIGTVLWFEALNQRPHQLFFNTGSTQVPVTSSRVGVVQLGEGYTAKRPSGDYVFPTAVRVAVLVHEARHSDCTGGIQSTDLEKLMTGDFPQSQSCGHLHVKCPAGHPYANEFACDKLPWGAYSIEALYATALSRNCESCAREDRKMAEAIAIDALSRVLPYNDMVEGKLGRPDMSSSAEIVVTGGGAAP